MVAQLQSELDSVMKSRAVLEARVANRGVEARAAEAEQEAEAIVSRLIPAIVSIISHLETLTACTAS
jgi:hypothetical protein